MDEIESKQGEHQIVATLSSYLAFVLNSAFELRLLYVFHKCCAVVTFIVWQESSHCIHFIKLLGIRTYFLLTSHILSVQLNKAQIGG